MTNSITPNLGTNLTLPQLPELFLPVTNLPGSLDQYRGPSPDAGIFPGIVGGLFRSPMCRFKPWLLTCRKKTSTSRGYDYYRGNPSAQKRSRCRAKTSKPVQFNRCMRSAERPSRPAEAKPRTNSSRPRRSPLCRFKAWRFRCR